MRKKAKKRKEEEDLIQVTKSINISIDARRHGK